MLRSSEGCHCGIGRGCLAELMCSRSRCFDEWPFLGLDAIAIYLPDER